MYVYVCVRVYIYIYTCTYLAFRVAGLLRPDTPPISSVSQPESFRRDLLGKNASYTVPQEKRAASTIGGA